MLPLHQVKIHPDKRQKQLTVSHFTTSHLLSNETKIWVLMTRISHLLDCSKLKVLSMLCHTTHTRTELLIPSFALLFALIVILNKNESQFACFKVTSFSPCIIFGTELSLPVMLQPQKFGLVVNWENLIWITQYKSGPKQSLYSYMKADKISKGW